MVAPVHIGQILASKYRVERILGEGGMGVVVAATHLELDSLVGLKFLLPAALESVAHVDRFLREARAAVKLKSEHTCQVKDVGRLEDGAPYIVMEFLDGNDLGKELERRGPLSMFEAASYVWQACQAMTEAHALGIVHRDLKPQNLFLTRRADGALVVKVLDFGIAKLRAEDGSATHTGMVMGSPAFMAPEQARSAKSADARADLYSLGVILYRMTTGRLPYRALEDLAGLSLTDILLAVQQDPAVPPRTYQPALTRSWEELVMRAIAKDPAARFQTATQLAEALLPFAHAAPSNHPMERVASRLASPVLEATVPPDPVEHTLVDPRVVPTVTPVTAPKPVRRPRRWLGAAILGGVVTSGAIVFAITRAPAEPRSPSSDPVPVTATQADSKVTVPSRSTAREDVPPPLLAQPIAEPTPDKTKTVPNHRTAVTKTEPKPPPPIEAPVVASPPPSPAPPIKVCADDDVVCQFGARKTTP